MNRPTIPRHFSIMSRQINVVVEPDMVYRHDRRGEARYRQNEVALQASTESVAIPFDHQLETFYHEMLHIIFNVIEREDLDDDEKLINLISRGLAQAALTAEGRVQLKV